MTRKHFQGVADAVASATNRDGAVDRDMLLYELCMFFIRTNPAFQPEKFRERATTTRWSGER